MLNVLKHDFLTALVLDNTLVIRQIECCRPHTVVAVTGRKHLIDDTNRRDRAESWIAVGRIDRQVVDLVCRLLLEKKKEQRDLGNVARETRWAVDDKYPAQEE